MGPLHTADDGFAHAQMTGIGGLWVEPVAMVADVDGDGMGSLRVDLAIDGDRGAAMVDGVVGRPSADRLKAEKMGRSW